MCEEKHTQMTERRHRINVWSNDDGNNSIELNIVQSSTPQQLLFRACAWLRSGEQIKPRDAYAIVVRRATDGSVLGHLPDLAPTPFEAIDKLLADNGARCVCV